MARHNANCLLNQANRSKFRPFKPNQNQILLYRLGVASWRKPSPQLVPSHTAQGYIGGESITTCVNLTNSGQRQ